MDPKMQAFHNAAIQALQQQRNTALDTVAELNARLFVMQQELKEIMAERDALKTQLEAATRMPDLPEAPD